MVLPRLLIAMGLVPALACGGRVAYQAPEQTSASMTVRYASEPSRRFDLTRDQIECWLDDSDYLTIKLLPTGDPSTSLLIELGPAGTGTFAAAGEAVTQDGGTFTCTEPCAQFRWVDGDVATSSHRSSDLCEVALVEEDWGWRGTFECEDMISEPSSEVSGTFYCSNAELRPGGQRPT